MQKAWRERNPQARIRAAYQALEMNQESVFFLSTIILNAVLMRSLNTY